MKVAVLGESGADEAATCILVAGILGIAVERIAGPALRTRGWSSVTNVLPVVMKHVYYRTDAEGLVVVVDCDTSVVHQSFHEAETSSDADCRLCQIESIARRTHRVLRPMPARAQFRFAIGLAVPAIEAWYRAGLDAGVSETAWLQGRAAGRPPYTKGELKRAVYGTDRPSLALATHRATEEANRLISRLEIVEQAFPGGFGALVRALRRW